jgi:cystathionine beta-lyase
MNEFDFSKIINRKGTYSTQWDYIADRFGRADLLPFTISDMDFETSPAIKEAVVARASHGVFGYSRWNHDEFKNAIISWYQNRFGVLIDGKMLAFSPTIIYGVAQLIERFSNEGDGVIVQAPGYDAFFNTVVGLKRKVLQNNLVYDEGRAEIDFEGFEKLAKQAKIVLLCNPHNPTGRAWTEAELKKIMQIVRENDLAIISDDAHQDIVYEPNKFISLAKVWGDYQKAVLLSSTAKGFNTASLGGAYAIFNSQKEKDFFLTELKVRGLSSAPVLFISALIAAYTKSQSWLEAFTVVAKNNLAYIDNFLKTKLPTAKMTIPQATYFAWINMSGFNLSSEQIQDKLINKGKVAIMSGKLYKQENPTYLRLNAACPLSKIEDGMDRIYKALND